MSLWSGDCICSQAHSGVERSFSVLGIGLMLRGLKAKGFAFSREEGGAGGDNHRSEEGPEEKKS